MQLHIENPTKEQWFYKKHDGGDFFSFRDSQGNFLPIFYPPVNSDIPADAVVQLTDQEYALIEPKETQTFNLYIPVNIFFEKSKGENIYFYYYNSGIPPSFESVFEQELFYVALASNQIKVRCYDYNESQDKYYCDVETLPNLPVFK